eukprot:Anaeramoba_flamelloidesa812127_45.p1 GENE.a812127_45~~a812127_45.p1  ORF type:complete len:770 (-),score=203.95 a812127_45:13-2322(-)
MVEFAIDQQIKLLLQTIDLHRKKIKQGGCKSLIELQFEKKQYNQSKKDKITINGKIIDNGDGTYQLIGNCHQIGIWKVRIFINKKPLLNNDQAIPRLLIIAGAIDLKNSEINGKNSTQVGENTIILLNAKDKYNNQITKGDVNITTRWRQSKLHDKIIVTDRKDGTYIINFKPTMSGQFVIEITAPNNVGRLMTRLHKIRILPKPLTITEDEFTNVQLIDDKHNSIVQRANWKGIDVAIKRVYERDVKLFESEIATLSILNHRNVIRLLGSYVSESKEKKKEFCLIMPFMKNGSLKEFIEKPDLSIYQNHQTNERKINLVKQIVDAMSYLHNSGILHLDLKPSNLLLNEDNDIKITDFGLSRPFFDEKSITMTGSLVIGTLDYMAPEMRRSAKCSEKSDVYSFGILLYELFTGKKPSAGLFAVLRFPENVPQYIKELIMRCLDENPKRRPSFFKIKEIISELNKEEDYYYKIDTFGLLSSKDCLKSIEIIKDKNNQDVARLFHLDSPHAIGDSSTAAFLFLKAETCFYRFIGEQNQSKYKVTQVTVIENPMLINRFEKERLKLSLKYKNNSDFVSYHRKNNPNDLLGIQYLQHLKDSGLLLTGNSESPIICYHGAKDEVIQSIAEKGLLNLSSTDPGYFGKCIWLTTNNSYSQYYQVLKRDQKKKSERTFKLVMCWVLLGKPYPVTKVQLGRNLENGYDAHYCLVTYKKKTRDLFSNVQDFRNRPMKSYYPSTSEELTSTNQCDEVGIFHPERILPCFVIEYKEINQQN